MFDFLLVTNGCTLSIIGLVVVVVETSMFVICDTFGTALAVDVVCIQTAVGCSATFKTVDFATSVA